MAEAFAWWLSLETLGILALPASFALFKNLPDRGYPLSKALGLLLLSYPLWILATLGVVPNGRGGALLVLIGLGIVALVILGYLGGTLLEFVKGNWRLILVTEGLFLIAFVAWVLIRAYNPEISATEKPMDFAFLNALRRSDYFPPHDPWLAGYSISYYYFGYLMAATLISLSGVVAGVGFNLALASAFALAALGVFSLLYNLVPGGTTLPRARAPDSGLGRYLPSLSAPFGFGLLGVVLLGLLGNLEGVLEMAHAHGLGSADFWGWVGVKGLAQPYASPQWYPTEPWWWWRATRVIDTVVGGQSLDYTITEFPFFSFLLGDLHPHVMALPFGLLALALSLNLWRGRDRLGPAWVKSNALRFLAWGLCLGALGFLNSWDLPTYGGLFGICLLIQGYRHGGGEGLRGAALLGLLLGVMAVALYLPFYGGVVFQGFGAGALATADASPPLPLALWRGPGTRPLHFLLVLGPFIFLAGSLLFSQIGTFVTRKRLWLRAAVAAPLALWALAEVLTLSSNGTALIEQPLRRLWPLFPLVATVAVISGFLRRRPGRAVAEQGQSEESDGFVAVLIGTSLLLILGTEFIYIRDVFGNRMNTVFKFYYQVWALLAIASAYGLYYLHRSWHPVGGKAHLGRGLWWVVAGVLVASALVYPLAALPSKTDAFSRQPTLDGMAFLAENDPAQAEALAWLERNAPNEAVVVEAVGEEWSDYGRISARTGLATILGWAGHEVQWRGSDRAFRGRDQEVARIYQSQDRGEVAELLRRYGVSYVYWGRLERSRYGQDSPGALVELARPVYTGDGVIIYQVRSSELGAVER